MSTDDEAARRWRHTRQLSFGVPRLRAVRLIQNHPENTAEYLYFSPDLRMGDHYVVLGEVAGTGHYMILNIRTGVVMPCMHHLDRFEEVPEDEL